MPLKDILKREEGKVIAELATAVTDYGYNDEYGYYDDWRDRVVPIIEKQIKPSHQRLIDAIIGEVEGMLAKSRDRFKEFGLQRIKGEIDTLSDITHLLKELKK